MMGDMRDGHSFVLVGPDGVIRWRADYGGSPQVHDVPTDHEDAGRPRRRARPMTAPVQITLLTQPSARCANSPRGILARLGERVSAVGDRSRPAQRRGPPARRRSGCGVRPRRAGRRATVLLRAALRTQTSTRPGSPRRRDDHAASEPAAACARVLGGVGAHVEASGPPGRRAGASDVAVHRTGR